MDIKEPKDIDIMSFIKPSYHENGLYCADEIMNEETDIMDASIINEDIDIQNFAKPLDEQEEDKIRIL